MSKILKFSGKKFLQAGVRIATISASHKKKNSTIRYMYSYTIHVSYSVTVRYMYSVTVQKQNQGVLTISATFKTAIYF